MPAQISAFLAHELVHAAVGIPAGGSGAKIGGSQRWAVALRRSGGCCEMVVENAHGLRQRRGPNAKSSLHKAHLAPDAGRQPPGSRLSFATGSHDFESLARALGRGVRFESAHRLDMNTWLLRSAPQPVYLVSPLPGALPAAQP